MLTALTTMFTKKKQVTKMNEQIIRVSYDTWKQFKSQAFYNDASIKTIVDEIAKGKRDPKTGKTI